MNLTGAARTSLDAHVEAALLAVLRQSSAGSSTIADDALLAGLARPPGPVEDAVSPLLPVIVASVRTASPALGRLPAVHLRNAVRDSACRRVRKAAAAGSADTRDTGDVHVYVPAAHSSATTDASAAVPRGDGAAAAAPSDARNDGVAQGEAAPLPQPAAMSKRTTVSGKRRRAVQEPIAHGASAPQPPVSSDGFALAPRPAGRVTERFADVGGVASVLVALREVVQYALTHGELYTHLGVDPPRGVLLHGPPGVGKTLLARAIGGEMGVHFRSISGPELVGGVSGESEARVRAVFTEAVAHAPSIVFIDEIDAIAPRRDGTSRGMERRVVAQLLACLDSLSFAAEAPRPSVSDAEELPVDPPDVPPRPPAVIVLAATSRPDSIDSALRRSGRFDREIAVPIPDEAARLDILRVLVRRMRLAEGVDLPAIARATPGYVGSDLSALTKEAAVCAVNRSFDTLFTNVLHACEPATQLTPLEREARVRAQLRDTPPLTQEQLQPLTVTHADFVNALTRVQPSALREGFATVPDVTWQDVGALADVRSELEMAIVQPLRRPELFAAVGLHVPAGVLLYGPPGCGKTLLAKAIANETSANFISVKGPELLDKYVGESERAVRQVFTRARASAPCIIFFDELDALAPRRGGPGSGSGNVTERVVNQLLTELDGLETRRDVFVLGATNRPDIIDPAMLRPGRLDKLLYVPLPKPADRHDILRKQTRKTPLAPDIDLTALAMDGRMEGFSGADLAGLVREASTAALSEYLGRGAPADESIQVAARHFVTAFSKTAPSVTRADERVYAALQYKLRRARGTAAGGDAAASPAPEPA